MARLLYLDPVLEEQGGAEARAMWETLLYNECEQGRRPEQEENVMMREFQGICQPLAQS